MQAIIFAGGLGMRLRSVVSEVPKPMANIHGKPFLSFFLDHWIKEGIERFILAVGYKHEVIQNYFGNIYRGIPIEYSIEDEPLGTGGALWLALRHLNSSDTCLIANGDMFFPMNLKLFYQYHQKHQADITMALKPMEENSRYTAISLESNGRISHLSSAMNEQACLINAGFYLASPEIFSSLEFNHKKNISLEYEIFPFLKEHKKFFGYMADYPFIDIGIPADYERFKNRLINMENEA